MAKRAKLGQADPPAKYTIGMQPAEVPEEMTKRALYLLDRDAIALKAKRITLEDFLTRYDTMVMLNIPVTCRKRKVGKSGHVRMVCSKYKPKLLGQRKKRRSK